MILLFVWRSASAQELYVFTEPASNMAAKSFGFRANNYLMKNNSTKKINYHLVPEIMWGVSKNVMIHAEAFLSNRNARFVSEGGGVYLKYRFYSVDEVHSHFRMALFGRYSFNKELRKYLHGAGLWLKTISIFWFEQKRFRIGKVFR